MKDTWFIQIQDSEGKVLLLNQVVGSYSKYNKWTEKAANKIVGNYPSASRWRVQKVPFKGRAII